MHVNILYCRLGLKARLNATCLWIMTQQFNSATCTSLVIKEQTHDACPYFCSTCMGAVKIIFN